MEGFQIFQILMLVLLCIFVGFILGLAVYDRIIMKKKMNHAIEIALITLTPLIENSIEEFLNSEEFKKINVEEQDEKRS